MKRFTHLLAASAAALAIAVVTPNPASAATAYRAVPFGGGGGSGSFTTEPRVDRDLGCFGFDTCNEVIALCIAAGHEYHGDSDQGWCDTNDNGKNDGHSPD